MIGIVIAIFVVAIGMGLLIAFFGKDKMKLGQLRERIEIVTRENDREAKAKQIESQPSPTTPDDVADAWSGMQYMEKK